MLNQKKIFNLLGLARRAQKLAFGAEAVLQGVKRKEIHLIIFATDASPNLQKKIKAAAGDLNICYLGSRSELGDFAGRETLGVIGVKDISFAKGILNLVDTTTE